MRSYKALSKNEFQQNEYSIVPIRDQDKFDIMKWRNEQIYHLRQKKKLTKSSQEKYFKDTVNNLFKENYPSQILFSFLKNGEFIGYGGLVHINWEDKNAEISFLINTELEKSFFNQYWTIFLKLIEKVAFDNLNFYKIFIYAFDLRKKLYVVLNQNNYEKEAKLKGHYFHENKFIDVLIYSKIIIK